MAAGKRRRTERAEQKKRAARLKKPTILTNPPRKEDIIMQTPEQHQTARVNATDDAIQIVLALADYWSEPEHSHPVSPSALIMPNDATIRDWVMAAAVNLRTS